jgi:hypothetical protein
MNYYQIQIVKEDSTLNSRVVAADTIPQQPADSNSAISNADITGTQDNQVIMPSRESVSAVGSEQPKVTRQSSSNTQNTVSQPEKESSSGEKAVSVTNSESPVPRTLSLFSQSDRPYFFKSREIWGETKAQIPSGNLQFNLRNDGLNHLNWTLIVGVISLFLILFLKTYYQKFVTKVMNTLVNFQLADTMLREKNSIVRRAFLIMNLNFIMILGLFTLLIARIYDLQYFNESWKDYLLIILIISSVMILRYLLFYAVGWIFEWMPAVNSHLHNSYLINKNMGLFLLPIVFMAIYTTPFYSRIVIIIGIISLIIANVFRLIRGFQVLIKNGILLFYAILYLCTLELLPIVLGSKLIILLR